MHQPIRMDSTHRGMQKASPEFKGGERDIDEHIRIHAHPSETSQKL